MQTVKVTCRAASILKYNRNGVKRIGRGEDGVKRRTKLSEKRKLGEKKLIDKRDTTFWGEYLEKLLRLLGENRPGGDFSTGVLGPREKSRPRRGEGVYYKRRGTRGVYYTWRLFEFQSTSRGCRDQAACKGSRPHAAVLIILRGDNKQQPL